MRIRTFAAFCFTLTLGCSVEDGLEPFDGGMRDGGTSPGPQPDARPPAQDTAVPAPPTDTGVQQDTSSPRDSGARDAGFADLPELTSFRTAPTDRFIVDIDVVAGGHPYLGANVSTTYPDIAPHRGAHLYYVPTGWPDYEEGSTIEATYPAIYAPVDGVVVNVATWKAFRGDVPGIEEAQANCKNIAEPFWDGTFPTCLNIGGPSETCRDIRTYDPLVPETDVDCFVPYTHYGCDVTLAIAVSGGNPVRLGYSIESFTIPTTSGRLPASAAATFYDGKSAVQIFAELDEHFYERFIHVNVGDHVSKGDIIAHHFLESSNADVHNAHIHYNLWRDVAEFPGESFVSPSIFSNSVMDELRLTWNRPSIPRVEHQCMGVLLDDSENPFSSLSAANDCVNAE